MRLSSAHRAIFILAGIVLFGVIALLEFYVWALLDWGARDKSSNSYFILVLVSTIAPLVGTILVLSRAEQKLDQGENGQAWLYLVLAICPPVVGYLAGIALIASGVTP